MSKVIIIEFANMNPHLGMSFEIAKRNLDSRNDVHYYFGGHDTLYQKRIIVKPNDVLLAKHLPESRAASLLKSKKFHFHSRVGLKKYHIKFNKSFEKLNDLMEFTYKDCLLGMSVASSLISDTKNSNPDLKEHSSLINTMLSSGAMVYDCTIDLLKKHNPDFVYIFNGRFCNYRSVMDACTALKVKYKIYERGSSNSKYFCKPYMPHNFSKIEEEMHEEWGSAKDKHEASSIASRFFNLRRGGQDTTWMSFTTMQKKNKLPEIDTTKKVVTYFSSSEDEFKAIGDLIKWERWPDQISALASLIKACEKLPNVQLIVRIHPHIAQKSKQDQTFWMSLQLPKGGILISPFAETDTYALIEKSNVVVTCGSTVGIEAVYWGTPSICLGPSSYSTLNAVHLPKDDAELQQMLENESLEVHPDRALPYGYHKFVFGNEFQFYQPTGWFEGAFIGVNLHKKPTVKGYKRMVKIKNNFAALLKK